MNKKKSISKKISSQKKINQNYILQILYLIGEGRKEGTNKHMIQWLGTGQVKRHKLWLH